MLYHVRLVGERRRILSDEYLPDEEFHEKAESGSAWVLFTADSISELQEKIEAFRTRFPDSRLPQEKQA